MGVQDGRPVGAKTMSEIAAMIEAKLETIKPGYSGLTPSNSAVSMLCFSTAVFAPGFTTSGLAVISEFFPAWAFYDMGVQDGRPVGAKTMSEIAAMIEAKLETTFQFCGLDALLLDSCFRARLHHFRFGSHFHALSAGYGRSGRTPCWCQDDVRDCRYD
jgi:hypothetical protein